MNILTAYMLAISLCLTIPSAHLQSTKSDQQDHAKPPLVQAEPGAIPEASIPIQPLYEEEEEIQTTPEKHYTRMGRENRLGIFIAAAVGTLTLMGMVYCIYSQFYNKNLYSQMQLHDDTDLNLDLSESSSSSFFPSSAVTIDVEKGPWKAGYGSISEAPSIISLSSPQSPLPSVLPFPPLSLSSSPLQTISAQDLERSFV